VTDRYQILAVGVPRRSAPTCAQRLLDHMHDRDIIAREPFTVQGIEALARTMKPWFEREGLKGKALASKLAAWEAEQRARRGWSPSAGARKVVSDPDRPLIGTTDFAFALEVVVAPKLVADLNQPVTGRCPACNSLTGELAWWRPPLVDTLASFQTTGAAGVVCPTCKRASPLDGYGFRPPGVACQLSLRFGNWSAMKPSFVAELTRVAAHPITPVDEIV
jgi:hypothetical protein